MLKTSLQCRIPLLALIFVGFPVSTALADNTLANEYVYVVEPRPSEQPHWWPTEIYRSVKTDQTKKGYGLKCDIGRAVPIPEKEGWFKNEPIADMSFHLTVIAIQTTTFTNTNIYEGNYGFAEVWRGLEQVKRSSTPLGQIGISWTNESADKLNIYLVNDLAQIDLFEGQGFYYRNALTEGQLLYETIANMPEPDYLLSDCEKRPKEVPHYVSQMDEYFDSRPPQYQE